MKLVFFGTGAFGLPTLEALASSGHPVLSVVTGPDKPQGRGLAPRPSPIKELAFRKSLPIHPFENPSSDASAAALRDLGADLFVVVSFGLLLPKRLLEIPRLGSLNVHGSLLPRWRGAAPVHWAYLSGDAETGVTVMRLVEKLDAGDVLLAKKTPVTGEDDVISLDARLAKLGAEALLEALDLLEKNKAAFVPQDEKLSSYARKIVKEDGHLDWTKTARQVERQVRAFRRWPSAHCFYQGKRLIVLQARAVAEPLPPDARPGRILSASAKEGLRVATQDGPVEVLELQAEGRKPLEAREFLKGFPLSPGGVLE